MLAYSLAYVFSKCFSITAENNLAFYKSGTNYRSVNVDQALLAPLSFAMTDDGVKLMHVETPLTVFNSVESYEVQHYACNTWLRHQAIKTVFYAPSLNNIKLICLACKNKAIKSTLAMLT